MEVYDQSGQPQYCEYDYPNGTPIKVLVRPDDIIHDDDSTQTALVIGRVFRGANYLYRLQLDDGQSILSLVASHHNHEIGSHIGILPLLEHVVVFDEKRSMPPLGQNMTDHRELMKTFSSLHSF